MIGTIITTVAAVMVLGMLVLMVMMTNAEHKLTKARWAEQDARDLERQLRLDHIMEPGDVGLRDAVLAAVKLAGTPQDPNPHVQLLTHPVSRWAA